MTPTDEQTAILDAATRTSDNLQINALAGTGKTSTLEMIERALPQQPILYLVFGAKNAKDATTRMLSTTTVRTFNACGHRAWAKAQDKNLTLNPKKSQDLYRQMISEVKDRDAASEMWDVFWPVVQGVATAKNLGYVPDGKFPTAKRLTSRESFHASLEETPDDFTGDLIDALLVRSIVASYEGIIDYNDQVYMPALFGGTFSKFPLVKVDEAQDLSPVNLALLERLCKHRIITVGDPWQAIYAFRGADSASMQRLKQRYGGTSLDLSISFRCPSEIVKNARWRVPHFKWSMEGGHVRILERLPMVEIDDSAAIICRNNAPLFRLGFRLLSSGRSVSVAGSDIGPRLLGILRKLGPSDLSRSAVQGLINDWESERLAKDSKTAKDMADCMRVFSAHGENLGQAVAYAEHLFGQKGSIRLLTGHKAKGLEWDTVYHLDPWLLKDDEQDLNLRYVIQTRSKDRYFEVNSTSIQ